jgi:hypothetical protein
MECFDKAFAQYTIPVGQPEQYALTIFSEPMQRGFAVVVDGGLVTSLPERGVCWTALCSTGASSFYRLAA